jgi:hypothetical protein
MEAPDNATAVALAMAVDGGGALSKIETTSLLDMSEAQEAMRGRLGDLPAAELASHASGTLSLRRDEGHRRSTARPLPLFADAALYAAGSTLGPLLPRTKGSGAPTRRGANRQPLRGGVP